MNLASYDKLFPRGKAENCSYIQQHGENHQHSRLGGDSQIRGYFDSIPTVSSILAVPVSDAACC